MRNVTKSKLKMAVPALVAAGFSTWMGSSAKGDFTVSVAPGNVTTINSVSYTDYIVSALINTTGANVGSTLLAVDVTVTTPGTGTTGALFVDIITSGTKHAANIDDVQSGGPGNGYGFVPDGTFAGVGSNAIVTPLSAGDSTNTATTQNVYDNGSFPTTVKYKLGGGSSAPDANFTAGTVHSLEVVANDVAGSGTDASVAQETADGNPTGPIPFFNIVVPTGTQNITVSGLLGGDSGSKVQFTPLVINPAITVTGPLISLSSTSVDAAAAANNIGSVAIVKNAGGSYVAQTVAVNGAAQKAGNLTVTGFTAGDQEIFGLNASSSTNLTTLISELNASLGSSGTAEVPTGSVASLLTNAGDDVEVVFSAAAGNTVFSYDLAGDTTSASITSITVVPEPTGIGALVLGGVGLLSRRKARKTA
jgi:hypothetical protein